MSENILTFNRIIREHSKGKRGKNLKICKGFRLLSGGAGCCAGLTENFSYYILGNGQAGRDRRFPEVNMKIDRKQASEAFEKYTARYNAQDEKVRLKIEHTWRVARLCETIARSLGLPEEETDLAWLIGLLHDVGRFEQLRHYGTFIDAESIDHAQYGAQLLFGSEAAETGGIRSFAADPSEDALIHTAVAWHSAYRIPDGLDERTARFCNILRDADKIDILKVNVDFPPEEIYNVSAQELRSCQVSPEVMAAFYEEHAVLRSLKKTAADHLIGHASLVYELVFPVSLRIVEEQGYLEQLLSFRSENPLTREQFAEAGKHMEAWLAGKKENGQKR